MDELRWWMLGCTIWLSLCIIYVALAIGELTQEIRRRP